MKIESDLEAKHIENLLKYCTKAEAKTNLNDSNDVIRAVQFLVRVLQDRQSPTKPLPTISHDVDVGKKVTPIKLDTSKGKKK